MIEPLSGGLPPGIQVLLAKPAFGVSTPQAYQRWKESREVPGIPYGPVRLDWGEVVNDLERPVFQKYPVLGDMKRWLSRRDGVAAAGMSGSGSTMMAFLESGLEERSVDGLSDALREEFGESLWIRLVTVQGGASAS